VIGDTVNSASRLEGLTRSIDTDLVVSEALVQRVQEESGGNEPEILNGLDVVGDQEVKGRKGKIPILALSREPET
ncbi:MAG: adenylate/guanylate cyclase domain-containing protein, partial [Boseongicola sp.]